MKHIRMLVVLVIFNSCSGVGYLVGGKQTSYEGIYTLPIHNSIEASKSKLKSVLFADGWNKVSENDSIIAFENASSKGSEVGMGKMSRSTITSLFTKEKITLTIFQSGNFKFGTEKSTNKTFTEIKEQYEVH